MNAIEQYFDNLLFEGKDIDGDPNRNALTEEEQHVVQVCAAYILYSIFPNRNFMKMYYEHQDEVIDFLYNSITETI